MTTKEAKYTAEQIQSVLKEDLILRERKAKISDDGHSLLVRIPKRIQDALKIKKGDHIKFKIQPSPEGIQGGMLKEDALQIMLEKNDTAKT